MFVQADEHADSFWSESDNFIIMFLGCEEKKQFQQWTSLGILGCNLLPKHFMWCLASRVVLALLEEEAESLVQHGSGEPLG